MSLQCISPDEIESTDLVAYLEGDARPSVRQHIEKCLYCQQETHALLTIDSLFVNVLQQANCPDTDLLWKYANEAAPKDETVAAHIAHCSHCQTELKQLKRACYTMPITSDTTDQTTFLNRLQIAGKQLIEAVLVSPTTQPAVAFRGEGVIQSTYKSDDAHILLVKTPPLALEKIWQVEGQIIALTDTLSRFEGSLTVHKNDEIVIEVPIDELGYFDLGKLTSGDYTLLLEFQEQILFIQDFNIP